MRHFRFPTIYVTIFFLISSVVKRKILLAEALIYYTIINIPLFVSKVTGRHFITKSALRFSLLLQKFYFNMGS